MDLPWQHLIVGIVVAAAVLWIARHFGLLKLPRRKSKSSSAPDVPVGSLVRKNRPTPGRDEAL